MNTKEKAKLAKQKLAYVQWLLAVRKMSTVELLTEVLDLNNYYQCDPLHERKYAFGVRLLRLRIEALERRK